MCLKNAMVGLSIAVIGVGCSGAIKPQPPSASPVLSQASGKKARRVSRRLASIIERSSEYSGAFDQGCSSAYEMFCDDLQSANGQGNMDLQASDGTLPVRFGENEAGFDYAFLFYQQAKLDAHDRLPQDLRDALDQAGYFNKLKDLLTHSGTKPNRVGELDRSIRMGEISTLWNSTLQKTALARFDRVHPGFSAMDPAPLAQEIEYGEFKDKFQGEVFEAFWGNHPRWLKLKSDFELLRAEYISTLEEIQTLPEDVQKEWIELIRTVQLVPPGGDMGSGSDLECGTTTVNAYYQPDTHRITVCAGLLGGSEAIGVLAHEISHSLDPNSVAMRYVRDSKFAGELRALWRTSCQKAPLQECQKGWTDLKNRKDPIGTTFDGFSPPAQQFLRCLQYHENDLQPGPDPKTLKDAAAGSARSYADYYANRDLFLNLVHPTTPNKWGKPEENSQYLNVCGTRDPKDYDFNPTDVIPLIYTLEFTCDQSSDAGAVKMKRSIEAAIEFQRQILEKSIPFGGRFSSNSWMLEQGLSEGVGERFADAMGFRVYGRLLKKMANVEDRRRHFLSNVSLFCDPPSLGREFSDEAQVEKVYSFEPHSDGKQRRLEVLTPAIREALQCSQDFKSKECTL